MTDKAPDAYRTISEVADDLDLPQHVLRFWETRFSQIRPLKRGGGRRYYRPDDVELLKGIRYLLYSEGYTIKGVQRILKEQGPKAVQTLVQGPAGAALASAPALHAPAPEDMPPEDFDAETPEDFSPPEPEPVRIAAPPAPAQRPAPPPVAPPGPDLFADLKPDVPASAAAPSPVPATAAVPAAKPNVSFMRGGLKPAAPAPTPAGAPPVLVRKPPPTPPVETPAPTPRFVPVFETPAEPQTAPAPVVAAKPAVPQAKSETLTPDQRRALQSALFELSECRRTIDRITASRGR